MEFCCRCEGEGDMGESLWGEREREGLHTRTSPTAEFRGPEEMEIRRSPSPGRSGRTLLPASSRRRSVDRETRRSLSENISVSACSRGHQSAALLPHSRLMTSVSAVAFKNSLSLTHTQHLMWHLNVQTAQFNPKQKLFDYLLTPHVSGNS